MEHLLDVVVAGHDGCPAPAQLTCNLLGHVRMTVASNLPAAAEAGMCGQDGKTLRKTLTGKPIFLFGGHAKGGGCDWMLPVTNLKFHSRLMVTPASGWTGHRVTLEYFCKQVR